MGPATTTNGYPPTWSASLNAAELGKHPTREAAVQCVEASVHNHMRPVLGDWIKFQVDPKRPKR